MKKGFSRSTIKWIAIMVVTTILASALTFFITKNNAEQKNLAFEVGQKVADVKWLAREGKISKEELALVLIAVDNSPLKEINQQLDELLDGKEEEYLAERAEFFKEFENILDS